mgnify:CR=1 FL=1
MPAPSRVLHPPLRLRAIRRTARRGIYAPRTIRFWTVQDAQSRLTRLLGTTPPGWSTLDAFLPDSLPERMEGEDALRQRRAAMAGTLIAGLELAKTGRLELRQDETFGQIMLRPHEQDAAPPTEEDEDEGDAPAPSMQEQTTRQTGEERQDA